MIQGKDRKNLYRQDNCNQLQCVLMFISFSDYVNDDGWFYYNSLKLHIIKIIHYNI